MIRKHIYREAGASLANVDELIGGFENGQLIVDFLSQNESFNRPLVRAPDRRNFSLKMRSVKYYDLLPEPNGISLILKK